MASTLTDLGTPAVITLGTAGNATKITLPAGSRSVVIVPSTSDVDFSNAGTDGAAISATARERIPVGSARRVYLARASHSFPPVIYVAPTVNSATVTISPEVTP